MAATSAARGENRPPEPGPGRTRDVIDALTERGALFQTDLTTMTGRLPGEIEDALWDGVARGLLTADGFRAVRSLFAQRALAQTALGRFVEEADVADAISFLVSPAARNITGHDIPVDAGWDV